MTKQIEEEIENQTAPKPNRKDNAHQTVYHIDKKQLGQTCPDREGEVGKRAEQVEV